MGGLIMDASRRAILGGLAATPLATRTVFASEPDPWADFSASPWWGKTMRSTVDHARRAGAHPDQILAILCCPRPREDDGSWPRLVFSGSTILGADPFGTW